MPLPAGEVADDEKWSRETVLQTPLGDFQQRANYRLLPRDPQQPAVTDIEVITLLDSTARGKSTRSTTLKEQEQRGVIHFDTERGYVRAAEMKQRFVATCA